MAGLEDILRRHRVVICAGSGGVGKTTTAAALALRAALAGKRTMVLTIDPAKRLANALGIVALGGHPAPVHVEDLPEGRLAAMMLDQKGAWDELVERHAPSPEMRYRTSATASTSTCRRALPARRNTWRSNNCASCTTAGPTI